MDAVARTNAEAMINRIFAGYRAAQPTDSGMIAALTGGKLYELFVLSRIVVFLSHRGFRLKFVGSTALRGAKAAAHTTLRFKAGPGMIKLADSHFELESPRTGAVKYRLFVNIEFDTLGHGRRPVSDDSRRHELDIVVTTATSGYPNYKQIALGVERKSTANFEKGILKEVLGIRREMCLLAKSPKRSLLALEGCTLQPRVAANPASEYIVVYSDPKGDDYSESPSVFGIKFAHLQP